MTTILSCSYFHMPEICSFLNNSEKQNSIAQMYRAVLMPQESMSPVRQKWSREPVVGTIWMGRSWKRVCLVSSCAHDICGRPWEYASKGQGSRSLMAFHGGRCPRAEMCIQFWGAEVRLDDKSQAAGGPTWDKEGRRSAGQLQSHQWWVDVRPAPMGYFLILFCGCLSYFLWLCELIRAGMETGWSGTQWGLLC